MQQLALTYPSPIFIEQFFRLAWIIVPDPDEYEYVRAPKLQAESFFDTGYLVGDCDDAATLSACLLKALEWSATLIAIRRPEESEFSHVFTRAFENDYIIDIDPIVPLHQMPIRDIAEIMQVSL